MRHVISTSTGAKLTFLPRWRETAGGLRLGPNSSNPSDRGFDRLLDLYTRCAAVRYSPS